MLGRAGAVAPDAHAPAAVRLEAVALLACGHGAESEKALLPLLDIQQPPAVQLAALTSLARLAPTGLAAALLSRWSSLTPAIREKAVDVLLKRPDRTGELHWDMGRGHVKRRSLDLLLIVG